MTIRTESNTKYTLLRKHPVHLPHKQDESNSQNNPAQLQTLFG